MYYERCSGYIDLETGFDKRASVYLRKELLRIYEKEKTWRERLWRNGITGSSPMTPRKHPDHVGTEEDPTCIICQQLLYLSAVVCRCRPSSFVCLEHWEHLCECKANKHRLLYRHSLAELNDLVHMTEELSPEDPASNLRGQTSSSNDSAALLKKVKHVQLAEEWLLKSHKILDSSYSRDSYSIAIKEAQQFLWGGSEMDPVRHAVKNLIQAKKWAQAVRESVSKLESWTCDSQHETGWVQMDHVDKLLSLDPIPCNESCHLKLKEYQQEAKQLIQEIERALAVCSIVSVAEWETLYLKTRDSPIYVKESEKLFHKLSSVKVWVENARKCIDRNSPGSVDSDVLYRLQAELLELGVQLPEGEILSELLNQVESCRSRCSDILKDSICLKKLHLHIREYDGFTVDVPELKLLREYHRDAMSWKSRVDHILVDIHCREDQENVVDELTSIQIDGLSLKVEVEELPLIGVELKKASCRVKGLKALQSKMNMDFLEQLITEANMLLIEKEKLFVDISEALVVAMHWEESAKHVLSNEADMSEFEQILRTSEDIGVILPSLHEVKNTLSMAKSWLSKSEPFLFSDSSVAPVSSSLLKLATLKELVSESKLLKISLREQEVLQNVLEKCIEWEQNANLLLDDTFHLLDNNIMFGEISRDLVLKLERQVLLLESITEAGLSLRLEFTVISKLQDACFTLRWCFKVLSFCDAIPTLQEVGACLEVSSQLPVTYASCTLPTTLVDGINWLSKALEILPPCSSRQIKLNDAEKVLELSQKLGISFPLMAGQIQTAIEKHNLWLEQVVLFLKLNCDDRSWTSLLHLKEIGSTNAFNCAELDMVLAEVEKVELWKQNCKGIAGISAGDTTLLTTALLEIKNSLDRSFAVYDKSKCYRTQTLCISCSTNISDEKLVTCSICKDCFHLQCVGSSLEDANGGTTYVCHYCNFVRRGKISRSKCGLMRIRQKSPDSNKLSELLSQAEGLCLWIEERRILHQIVEKAVECSACLMEIVDFALSYKDRYLSGVAEKLVIALKALDMAGAYDSQGNSKFELALARNSWKVGAHKLLQDSQKPTIQQVQRHLKEGLAISVPPEDYFRKKLAEVRHMGMQWADTAKKVSMDGGALGLDKVYELIAEGEQLPLVCEKELKLLRDRSMLYCICRRPYDQRAMIACDKCDEWYHFDCIKLSSPPKVYICPACCDSNIDEDLCSSMPKAQERCTSGKVQEPQTPSPRRSELRKKSRTSKPVKREDEPVTMEASGHSRGIERLLWRNRKPFRRLARKRADFQSLTPFFYVRNKR